MNSSAPGFKIAIPSAGRAATIRTPLLLPPDLPYTVVTHDVNDAAWYRKNQLLDKATVLVSHVSSGIARQRNWILENLVAPGRWVLMLDDNIKRFEKVDPHFYGQEQVEREALDSAFWRKIYRQPATWSMVKSCLRESIWKAERIGANLIGFASAENPGTSSGTQ